MVHQVQKLNAIRQNHVHVYNLANDLEEYHKTAKKTAKQSEEFSVLLKNIDVFISFRAQEHFHLEHSVQLILFVGLSTVP